MLRDRLFAPEFHALLDWPACRISSGRSRRAVRSVRPETGLSRLLFVELEANVVKYARCFYRNAVDDAWFVLELERGLYGGALEH